MKWVHVKLIYFKQEGKFYSEGELDVPYVNDRPPMFHECLAAVRQELLNGKRPGLVDGYDFHTLATVYTEFGPLLHLFARNKSGDLM